MAKKKACKDCNLLVEGDTCPVCKKQNLSQSWVGRINVIDAAKSRVSKKMGLSVKGEYAIKVK